MPEIAQAFTIGGYVLAVFMAVGYAKLLIARPAERKATFFAIWLACSVALLAAFRFWIQPDVMAQFAHNSVDMQLASQPGLAEVARRHPQVRTALERMAIARLNGAGTADDTFIAANAAFVEAMHPYRSAYLAIAADRDLLNYIAALATVLNDVNERTGLVCGAFLNGDLATIAGTINNSANWIDLAAADDAALFSAFARPHALLPAERVTELDANLTQFLDRRYGRLRAQVLLNAMGAPAPADDPELCAALVAMFEYALALPAPDRQDMIRMLFQEDAMSRDMTDAPSEPATSTL